MLSKTQDNVDTASQLISKIHIDDASFNQSITQLNSLLADLQNKLQSEKQFVTKYINTKKLFRPLLFRKIG